MDSSDDVKKTLNRITKNEERLNSICSSIKKLENSIKEFESNQKNIDLLNRYYGSKNWFKDKDNYENNKIPKIKAGVLSEDAVWNLNDNINEIIEDMQSIVNKWRNLD